jgi:hypothetical protein
MLCGILKENRYNSGQGVASMAWQTRYCRLESWPQWVRHLADCVVWAVDQGAQVLHLSLLAIRTVPLWKLKAGMIPRCHSTSSRWASGRVSRPHAPHARSAALRRGPARCDRAGRACPGGVPSSCRDTASGWCCDGDLFTVRGVPVRFDVPPARSRADRRSLHALSGKICADGENGRRPTRTFLER